MSWNPKKLIMTGVAGLWLGAIVISGGLARANFNRAAEARPADKAAEAVAALGGGVSFASYGLLVLGMSRSRPGQKDGPSL